MRNPLRNVMRSVKVEKNELLGIVRDNKKKHVKEFDESVKDYKKAALKVAKEHVELAKSGDLEQIAKRVRHFDLLDGRVDCERDETGCRSVGREEPEQLQLGYMLNGWFACFIHSLSLSSNTRKRFASNDYESARSAV